MKIVRTFDSYKKEGRIEAVDFLKLIAACMVIFSHCLLRYVDNWQYGFVYNLLWITQMPLFMFCSGFLNNKSSKLPSLISYFYKTLKNALVLLVPCLSYLLLTSALYGHSVSDSFIAFYLNPESNLWFLWVLFIIHVVFDFGLFISNKFSFKAKSLIPIFLSLMLFILLFVLMKVIGSNFDFSILSLKLIAFYTPFYCVGYIFYLLVTHLKETKLLIIAFHLLFIVCSGVALFVCIYFDSIYYFDDSNVKYLFIRMFSSLCSIYCLFYLVNYIVKFKTICKISKLGAFTLQSYYLHIIYIRYLTFSSPFVHQQWFISIGVFFLLISMVIATVAVVYFIPYLHLILFGKSFSKYKIEKKLPLILR